MGVFNIQHSLRLHCFNNEHGYGMLEDLTSCLGVYALRYYCKLEVAYKKYYLNHTTTISHKLTFVMARKDHVPDTIEKMLKEDSMETRLWA